MSGATNRGYAKVGNPILRRLLGHPLTALGLHWIFQSMLYMDRTERLFKLGLDALLTLVGGRILLAKLPYFIAWPIAFVVAHTLNFLFNGHLWGALKHYGLVRHSYEDYSAYVNRFAQRVEREQAIQWAVLCGSLSRDQWSPTSDLDVRLLRQPGVWNGLRACGFLLQERTRALIARFPLDGYVLDTDESLARLSKDDQATTLLLGSPVLMRGGE